MIRLILILFLLFLSVVGCSMPSTELASEIKHESLPSVSPTYKFSVTPDPTDTPVPTNTHTPVPTDTNSPYPNPNPYPYPDPLSSLMDASSDIAISVHLAARPE